MRSLKRKINPLTSINIRGQSLVEMTFIIPILMLILVGLIEIGWYANNYLTMLDIARGAARFAAFQDPTNWPENSEEATTGARPLYDPITDGGSPGPNINDCGGGSQFFVAAGCVAMQNMNTTLDDGWTVAGVPMFDPSRDDLVVSVFAYRNLDTGFEIYRYPADRNRCDGDIEPANVESTGIDGERGYCWTCNHQIGDRPGCFGSEFSTEEVRDMLLNNFATALYPARITPNAVVLVEIFWHSDQLLNLPGYSFLTTPTIHVWSMFPVQQGEGFIPPTPVP